MLPLPAVQHYIGSDGRRGKPEHGIQFGELVATLAMNEEPGTAGQFQVNAAADATQ